ncbi:MAG: yajC [Alphaproteobacteria bacterium]|nr:yajC [Alphaproteobacteria bacterium]
MFISSAFAQDAAVTAATTVPAAPPVWYNLFPLIGLLAIFYLLVIRPQSKRMREHADLVKALKPGDKVITGGGLFGKIVKIGDDDMTIEIAPGINVKAQKHTVAAIQDEPKPANDTKADTKQVK